MYLVNKHNYNNTTEENEVEKDTKRRLPNKIEDSKTRQCVSGVRECKSETGTH